jgi:phasin family protein
MAKAKTQNGNPFLNGDFAGLMDFGKFAEQFNFAGIDSNAVLETHRKNLEAVTKANQMAFEGAQALVERQVEILRQNAEETAKAVRELSQPGKPADKLVAQTEMVKEAYETALANLRELVELSVKSNTAAAEVLNHRFTDGLEEFKGAIKTAEKSVEKAAEKTAAAAH